MTSTQHIQGKEAARQMEASSGTIRRILQRRLWSGLLTILVSGVLLSDAQAVNRTWVTLGDGDWTTAANWTGGTRPGTADLAFLTNSTLSYTVNFATNATDTYTISNFGAVSNNNTFTTTLNVNTGTLATLAASGAVPVLGGGGIININSGGVLKTTFGMSITNGGLMTINTGGGFTNTSTSGSGVAVSGSGVLSMQGGFFTTTRLTLAPTAILNFGLTTPGANNAIKVTSTGALTLDGTVNVNDLGGFTTGSYLLFTYTGALVNNTLDVGTLPGGFSATIDTGTTGEVRLSVVPEPATIWLCAGGLLGLFAWSRKRFTGKIAG